MSESGQPYHGGFEQRGEQVVGGGVVEPALSRARDGRAQRGDDHHVVGGRRRGHERAGGGGLMGGGEWRGRGEGRARGDERSRYSFVVTSNLSSFSFGV